MYLNNLDFLDVAASLGLESKLAVVCHDAGAANVIFAWLRVAAEQRPQMAEQWQIVLSGPALRLWAEQPIAGVSMMSDLALHGVQVVLTGTGWASDVEHDARKLAKVRGIHSIAVIDHWVNYPMRFERNGQTVLPDQIVVTDPYAAVEARRCFPTLPIVQWPNYYLQESVKRIRPLQPDDDGILYLLEPIRADWAGTRGGEFEALDFFVDNLRYLSNLSSFTLRLRPHPSDPPGKYDQWIKQHAGLHVQLDDADSLSEAIGQARWVVGAETFAMVVALAAGRQVVSTLPPWAHRCRLPHEGIIHLRDLLPTGIV